MENLLDYRRSPARLLPPATGRCALLILGALALLGCRVPQSALAKPDASTADEIAREVFGRYEIKEIGRDFPDAPMRRREIGAVAFDRALSLAVESFLGHRDHPRSLAALAAAAPADGPCAGKGAVARAACYMNRPDSTIALAALPPAALDRHSPGSYWIFALKVPSLAKAPFWVGVGSTPSGDAVAAQIPPRQIAMWCEYPESSADAGSSRTESRPVPEAASPQSSLVAFQGGRTPRGDERLPAPPAHQTPDVCAAWKYLERSLEE